MNNLALDAGIPVLTEIIEAPPQAAGLPGAGVAPAVAAETQPLPALDDWIEEEWNRMERKISAHISQQLMARLDAAIEEQVRNSLTDVLQAAVDGLAAEIKHNLQNSLEQVIAQAVSQEIAQMQFLEK